jgi:hypothetical protein
MTSSCRDITDKRTDSETYIHRCYARLLELDIRENPMNATYEILDSDRRQRR